MERIKRVNPLLVVERTVTKDLRKLGLNENWAKDRIEWRQAWQYPYPLPRCVGEGKEMMMIN